MRPASFIRRCLLATVMAAAAGIVVLPLEATGQEQRVRGQVVDRDGTPVTRAQITLFGGAQTSRTWTRDDGFFDLTVAPSPRGLTLRTEAEGFVTLERPFKPTEFAAGNDAVRRIVLLPPSAVVGRVVTPDGTPSSGADLRLQAVLKTRVSETARNRSEGETEESGFFRLDYERPGTYQLTASSPAYAAVMTPVFELPARGETTDLGDIILQAGDSLRGKVSTPGGEPISGVTIQASPPNDGMRVFDASWLRYERTAETDNEGLFVLKGLRPRDRLQVEAAK